MGGLFHVKQPDDELTFLTNWTAEARTSSSVAGWSKLKSV